MFLSDDCSMVDCRRGTLADGLRRCQGSISDRWGGQDPQASPCPRRACVIITHD
jgi:hypothetical protein